MYISVKGTLHSPAQVWKIKISNTLRNGKSRKISYTFSKERCFYISYISGKENPEKIIYISRNRNFKKLLILQEVTFRAPKIKTSYISGGASRTPKTKISDISPKKVITKFF